MTTSLIIRKSIAHFKINIKISKVLKTRRSPKLEDNLLQPFRVIHQQENLLDFQIMNLEGSKAAKAILYNNQPVRF